MEETLTETPQEVEQIDPPKKLSVKDFAAKIKAKYPDYSNVDDSELVKRITAKYPEYNEQVDYNIQKKIFYKTALRMAHRHPYLSRNLHYP